jgi:putative transcriptional regulator
MKKSTRRRRTKPRVGPSLIRGLTEFRDALRDDQPIEKRFTVRTVILNLEPGAYGPAELRAIRTRFETSQGVFAQLIGVSVKTVQSWEQGSPVPAIARRLLDVMLAEPAPWQRMLQQAATVRKAS